jgi:hypothetical protein
LQRQVYPQRAQSPQVVRKSKIFVITRDFVSRTTWIRSLPLLVLLVVGGDGGAPDPACFRRVSQTRIVPSHRVCVRWFDLMLCVTSCRLHPHGVKPRSIRLVLLVSSARVAPRKRLALVASKRRTRTSVETHNHGAISSAGVDVHFR